MIILHIMFMQNYNDQITKTLQILEKKVSKKRNHMREKESKKNYYF